MKGADRMVDQLLLESDMEKVVALSQESLGETREALWEEDESKEGGNLTDTILNEDNTQQVVMGSEFRKDHDEEIVEDWRPSICRGTDCQAHTGIWWQQDERCEDEMNGSDVEMPGTFPGDMMLYSDTMVEQNV
jgi:hypothetical protein